MPTDNKNGPPRAADDDITRPTIEMSRMNTTGSANPLNIIDSYGFMDDLDRNNTASTDYTIAAYTGERQTDSVEIDITALNTRLNQLKSRPSQDPDNSNVAKSQSPPGKESTAAWVKQHFPQRGLQSSPEMQRAVLPGDQGKQDTSKYIPPRIAGQGSRDEPRPKAQIPHTVQQSASVPIPPPPRQFYQPGVLPLKEEPKSQSFDTYPARKQIPATSKPLEPPSQSNASKTNIHLSPERSPLPSAAPTPVMSPAARETTLVPNQATLPIPDFPKRDKAHAPTLPQLTIPKQQPKPSGEVDISDMNSSIFLRPLRKVSEKMRRKNSKKELGGSRLHFEANEPITSMDSSSTDSLERKKYQSEMEEIMRMPVKAQSTDTTATKFDTEADFQDRTGDRKSQDRRRPKKDRRKKQSMRKRMFGSITPFTVLLLVFLLVNIFLLDTMIVFILVKVFPDISKLQDTMAEVLKVVNIGKDIKSNVPGLPSATVPGLTIPTNRN